MTEQTRDGGLTLTRDDFLRARENVAPHVYHTPLLTSRSLSKATGFDVRLKAELFQKGGAYKVRGPMNKIALMSEEERRRGVICSSAGNHSQGVALAASHYGVQAVVVALLVIIIRVGGVAVGAGAERRGRGLPSPAEGDAAEEEKEEAETRA